jgi:hypothetical protein
MALPIENGDLADEFGDQQRGRWTQKNASQDLVAFGLSVL